MSEKHLHMAEYKLGVNERFHVAGSVEIAALREWGSNDNYGYVDIAQLAIRGSLAHPEWEQSGCTTTAVSTPGKRQMWVNRELEMA
ncbi:MAG: hypothetical protein LBR21_02050 [Propionibacteriaceae bacterium]|jgi:hypothetical protein|nr:hypothetical protein [Propionibacteriaceae bacterium]